MSSVEIAHDILGLAQKEIESKNYSTALQILHSLLQSIQQTPSQHTQIISIQANSTLAHVYTLILKYQQALEYILKAYSLANEIGHVPSRIVTALNVSKTYTLLNRYKNAIVYCKECTVLCLRQLQSGGTQGINSSTELTEVQQDENPISKICLIHILSDIYYHYAKNLNYLCEYQEALKYTKLAADISQLQRDAQLKDHISNLKKEIEKKVFSLSLHSKIEIEEPYNKCSQQIKNAYAQKLKILHSPTKLIPIQMCGPTLHPIQIKKVYKQGIGESLYRNVSLVNRSMSKETLYTMDKDVHRVLARNMSTKDAILNSIDKGIHKVLTRNRSIDSSIELYTCTSSTKNIHRNKKHTKAKLKLAIYATRY